MSLGKILVAALALTVSAALAAPPRPPRPHGPPGPGGPGGPGGPFGSELSPHSPSLDELYPPDQVLANQIALDLTDSQIQTLKRLLVDTHSNTLDIEFSLQRAVETLHSALGPPRVDEAAALAAADKVMQLESSIKKAHLTLLIRVKNLLTPEQQTKLQAMRPQRPPPEGRD